VPESEVPAGATGATGTGKKSENDWFAKHKLPIMGVGAVILVILFIFMRRSSSSSSAANTAAAQAAETPSTSDIDPETGYPYGSAADLAALGASSSAASIPSGSTGTVTNNYYTTPATTSTTPTSTLPAGLTIPTSGTAVIPNVRQLPASEAQSILTAAGFNVGMNVPSPSSIVGSQSYAGNKGPGTVAPVGSTVDIGL
jgi:hypothetical protein